MRCGRALSWLGLCCGLFVSVRPVHAQIAELPRSVVAEALSEYKPSGFPPADFGVEDFALRRLGEGGEASSPAMTLTLAKGSLQWVRVAKVVLVPRAVLTVRVPGVSSGQVRYGDFAHSFVVKDGVGWAEVPVVLLPSSEQAIEIETRRGGVAEVTRYAVVFEPRPQRRAHVLFDSSCSPSGLRVLHGAIPEASFLYVGCRQIRTAYDDRIAATLELYVIFGGAGESVEVDGTKARPVADGLYTLRVAPQPGFVRLRAGDREVVLGYNAPERLSSAFLGAGIGPYAFHYEEGAFEIDTWLPVLTIYAGYAFTPATRVVYFNALIPDPHGSIDQGLYLWLEQARFMDDRMSFNLLLGGNLLIYREADKDTRLRVSVPQGIELVVRDVFARNLNLTGGAFLYPEIQGRAYYNFWLRLGSPQFFGEINYIEWREPHGGTNTESRVVGLCFGTPLYRFL